MSKLSVSCLVRVWYQFCFQPNTNTEKNAWLIVFIFLNNNGTLIRIEPNPAEELFKVHQNFLKPFIKFYSRNKRLETETSGDITMWPRGFLNRKGDNADAKFNSCPGIVGIRIIPAFFFMTPMEVWAGRIRRRNGMIHIIIIKIKIIVIKFCNFIDTIAGAEENQARHDLWKRLVITNHSLVDTVRLLSNHIGMEFRLQICGVCEKREIWRKYRYGNIISALNFRALPVRRCRAGSVSWRKK